MSIGSLQLVRTWSLYVQDGIPSSLQKRNSVKRLHVGKTLARGFLGSSSEISKSYSEDGWSARLWYDVHTFPCSTSTSVQPALPLARASAAAVVEQSKNVALSALKAVSFALARSATALRNDKLVVQCAPAVALMAFSVWGLEPTACFLRKVIQKKEDGKWSTSPTQHMTSSYVRPILLWIGVIMICRAFDPVILSSEASQAIKGRFINFVRSLSTVLAFAYCTASLTQQIQKTVLDRQEKENSRNLGVQFVGNTVYTSVWVAAVCLFMELLGFSTQRLITAGGFGTVLLTLAGREIFTNFLSSIMIHATRPFMENEWIQTKIEGQEVSGTVEHVGWWSPTVIRGDDREAVHIPNHKFTVSVVRNLTQKTHWRIKTHLGISHLDIGKIADIVSDMRKVISKHPQVEQQRLHRRAFFDKVDPESQALLVLVSCFVKTCHFEEYLRVKEIILLDLMRVISHHNARLATPIRSVQRILDETEARHGPFRDVSRSPERRKPMYMIEASTVSVNDSDEVDSGKGETALRTADFTKDPAVKAVPVKADRSVEEGSESKTKTKTKQKEKAQVVSEVSAAKSGASSPIEVATSTQTSSTKQLEGLDSMGLNSNDITLLKAAYEKPPADIPQGRDSTQGEKVGIKASTEQEKLPKPEKSYSPSVTQDLNEQVAPVIEMVKLEPAADPWKEQPQVPPQSAVPSGPQKSEIGQSKSRSSDEKVQAPAPAPVTRLQIVEENLVLGVALDGPKRTLPLDDEIPMPAKPKELVPSRSGTDDPPLPAKPRELVTSRNGSGSTTPKDRRDTTPSVPQQNSSGAPTQDGRDT